VGARQPNINVTQQPSSRLLSDGDGVSIDVFEGRVGHFNAASITLLFPIVDVK
jgi:hypothetical protein